MLGFGLSLVQGFKGSFKGSIWVCIYIYMYICICMYICINKYMSPLWGSTDLVLAYLEDRGTCI